MFGDKLDGKAGARHAGMRPPLRDEQPAGDRGPGHDQGTSGGHRAADAYWPAGDYWPVSETDRRRIGGPGRGLRRPEPARLSPPA